MGEGSAMQIPGEIKFQGEGKKGPEAEACLVLQERPSVCDWKEVNQGRGAVKFGEIMGARACGILEAVSSGV